MLHQLVNGITVKIILSCMLGIFSLLPAVSIAEIYKCTVNGKLVFTDQPCDGEKVTLGVINSMEAEETPFVYEPLKHEYNSSKWYYGHSGYKRALRLQKKYNAPIFLYFQADWCSYCRKLEGGLLNTSEGAKAISKAIKVKVSPEDSKQDDDFFRSMGGTGYPTLFLKSGVASGSTKIPVFRNQKMISASQLSQLVEL